MDIILDENDMRKAEDMVLINAINRYCSPSEFKKVITHLAVKNGYGDSYVNFYFWDSLDEYDKTLYDTPFKGVEVDYLDDVRQYDLRDLFYYVSLAAKRYMVFSPYEKYCVNKIINKMKNNFNCK